jgi:hypothetical protein
MTNIVTYTTLAGPHEESNEEVPGSQTGTEILEGALAAKTAAETAAAAAAAQAALAAAAASSVDAGPVLAARDVALAAQAAAETARTGAEVARDAAEAFTANVDQAMEDLTDSVAAAGTAATAAEAEADRARTYVTALPGQEIEPDVFGSRHWLEQQRQLLARAPSLQGRMITGGSAGDNPHPTEVEDFFTSILVNRTTGKTTLVQPQAGQWLGPPEPPHTHSWAWQEWVCLGEGEIEFEPPAGGSAVFQASPIITPQFRQVRSTLSSPPAASITFVVTIPAGIDRVLLLRAASTYQAGGPFTVTAGITGTGVTGFTTHETTGNGLHGNVSPILTSLHSAEITGGSVTDITVDVDFPASCVCGEVLLEAYQDCDGVELADIILRAGTGTTEAYTVTPTVPQSTVSVMAIHHGGDKAPVALTGVVTPTQNSTGSRDKKDFANVWGQDYAVPASSQTYTATAPLGGAAAISGIVLKPISRTTGGTGTFIVDADWAPPYIIGEGDSAELRALSDGLTWWLRRI